MKTSTKYRTISHVLVFYFFILCISCSHQKSIDENEFKQEIKIRSNNVDVKIIRNELFVNEILTNGKVSAVHKSAVKSKLTELVTQIYVREGDFVKKGELIAELDSSKIYLTFLQEEAKYKRSKLDYLDFLFNQGYLANDIENIPDDLQTKAEIKSGLAQAEVDYLKAKRLLQGIKIYATSTGRINNLSIQKGFWAEEGKEVCIIISNNLLKAEFQVLEDEVQEVFIDQKVDIIPLVNNNLLYNAKITSISPTVVNGLINVQAEFENYNSVLLDGMSVKIVINIRKKQKIFIPKTAILLRNQRQMVFIYSKGLAHWKYIGTGDENSTSIIVTEGISLNDTLIISGHMHLGHEVPVNIMNIE